MSLFTRQWTYANPFTGPSTCVLTSPMLGPRCGSGSCCLSALVAIVGDATSCAIQWCEAGKFMVRKAIYVPREVGPAAAQGEPMMHMADHGSTAIQLKTQQGLPLEFLMLIM